MEAATTHARTTGRKDGGGRGILYLMFAAPPLFTLTFSLTRMAGIDQHLAVIWILVWVAIGLMLYLKEGRGKPGSPATDRAWLRIVHGVVALCLLCGFLIAHLINHDLAVWSVRLHGTVMKFLRLWYRSEWVQPILLAMLVIMIGTGVPLVVQHARQRMDAFRVVQTATGIYIGAFAVAGLGLVVTVLIAAAMLGFHVRATN
jgi:hypothetical protein